jgi:hypothetical protein
MPADERAKHAVNAYAQHRQRNPKLKLLDDHEWMAARYEDDGWAQQEIADAIGCTRTAVKHALQRLGIALRTKKSSHIRAKMSGSNNYAWKGGVYNGKVVGFSGNSYQRHVLRKRLLAERGQQCEWCGCGGRIEVHHPVPYRFCHHNDDVILLCTRCHGKADMLFLEEAGKYFASAGCPGYASAVSTLRSGIAIATT